MRQVTKDILLKTERHLDQLNDQLIAELKKIVEGDWGLSKSSDVDKVNLIDIEVFIDGYRLVLYPMNNEGTQLGHRSLLKDAYPNGVLNAQEFNPNYDDYDFQNEDDNNDLEEFDKTQKDIFTNWFMNCWTKIESSVLKIPIYLCFHDDDNSIELKVNK